LMLSQRVSPQEVFGAITGEGRCGDAISGTMDLDNIDNVARMLSRLGVMIPSELALNFTDAFCLTEGKIRTDVSRIALFEEWLILRRQLYNKLMLQPDDFSAKTMTKLAVAKGLKEEVIYVTDWSLSDATLLEKLGGTKAPTRDLVRRLLLGDYFRVIYMCWVEGDVSLTLLSDVRQREEIQTAAREVLGDGVFIDYIKDKRERSIDMAPRPKKALCGVMSSRSCPTVGGAAKERSMCEAFVRSQLEVVEEAYPLQSGSIHGLANGSEPFLPFPVPRCR
ncbi:hypothetical protein LCGC14_2842570, partial [marine sediment metagenome]